MVRTCVALACLVALLLVPARAQEIFTRSLARAEAQALLPVVSEIAAGAARLDALLALVDGFYDPALPPRDKPSRTTTLINGGAPRAIAALKQFRAQLRSVEAALWIGRRYPDQAADIVMVLRGPATIINRLDMAAEDYIAELEQLAAIPGPIPPALAQLTVSRLGLPFSAAMRDAQAWRDDLVGRRIPEARRVLNAVQ
jgi:hypothetical protein